MEDLKRSCFGATYAHVCVVWGRGIAYDTNSHIVNSVTGDTAHAQPADEKAIKIFLCIHILTYSNLYRNIKNIFYLASLLRSSWNLKSET